MDKTYRATNEFVKTRGGDKELKDIRRQEEALKQQKKERKAELDARKKTRDNSFSLSKVDRRGENSEDDYGSGYGSGSNYDEPEEYDEGEIPEKGPGKDEPKPTSRSKTQSIRSEQRGNSVAQASGSRSGRKDHGSTGYASSITTESTLVAERPEKLLLGWKDRTARQSDVAPSESQRRSKHSSRPEENPKKHETLAENIRRNNEFVEKLREKGHGPAAENYQASEYSAVPSVTESRVSTREVIKDGKHLSRRSTHGEDSGRSTRHKEPREPREPREHREHREHREPREHRDRDREHKDRDREHKDGERKHRSKDHEIPLRIKDTESDGRGPHKSSRRSAPESEAGSTTKSSTTRSSTTKSSRTTSNRSYDEEPDSGSETETEKRSRDKRSHGRSRKAESEYYSTRATSPTNASQVSRNTAVRKIKGPVDEGERRRD
ncbi:hypothetical protein QC760_000788 [Botrytis cinerea]